MTPAPQTLTEWEAFRTAIEQKEGPRSKKTVDTLADKIEIRLMNGVAVHVITPKRFNPANADKALIHIHGGGYCVYSSKSSYFVCATLADYTGLRVYCVDYRLAPEHPFPAGLNDCVAAYRAIITEVAPGKIGMFGISAGGSMILATILKAQAEGLPLPGAVGAMSPGAVDFTTLGDTGHTLDGVDPVLRAELVRSVGIAYAGGAALDNPLISPLYAEYSDKFPPTIIQTGTRDLFLSGCATALSSHEGRWRGSRA